VELSARLAALQERCRERDRELDLLEHELAEIESGAVDEHQHDQLLATRERMRRVDALCAAAGAAAEELVPESAEAQGAAALLASAGGRLQSLAGVDAQLDVLAERTRSLAIEAHELAGELRAYGDGVLAAGGEGHAALALDQLEQRLEATERLARKYGGSARSVCEYAQRARARSDELKLAGVEMGQAGEQLARVQGELEEHVCALRAARRSAAPRLAAAVREQLAALGMGDADFEVRLTEREPGPGGGDAVEFVISPNPGVPAGPVREIASGGELSRIMLALTAAGARAARQRRRGAGAGGPHTPPASGAAVPTLAFDELDAGIGGRAARAVGSRLRELARARQLLCITHLPQIASLGERHFSIVKDTAVSPAVARVMQLEEGDVVAELVRMLGADASDSAAARHARDLRRVA
jgi:DNA repair protein RecN (Recombination protein N)